MKSLLMTGWRGTQYARFAAHTLPRLDEYAKRHGMDFQCVSLSSPTVPPSWMKLPNIGAALEDNDRVVWIDIDVVVVRSDESIVESISPGAVQGVVEHRTDCGQVPNCGVWLLTQEMAPWLLRAWFELLPTYRDCAWWEQAAIMELMGYAVQITDGTPHAELKSPTELYDRTCFLPAKWNDHPADAWRDPRPAFVHVTQYEDRLSEIRRLCACEG